MSSPISSRANTEPKFTILAVDDNEVHCYALQKLLNATGYFDVTAVHTGAEAIETVNRQHPDAVLLDIGLGDMSGFDVCESIRASAANDRVAIVFHSASGHAQTTPQSAQGADAFLTYPVDSAHLTSVIRGCIQRRRDHIDVQASGASNR